MAACAVTLFMGVTLLAHAYLVVTRTEETALSQLNHAILGRRGPLYYMVQEETPMILVLDANTGQNSLAQVRAFDAALGLTGLILTKLDGTAKGGVVCAIAKEKPVPLLFVGVGEGIDDLRPFAAREFAEALVG